jgi:hypothetical protein
MRSAYFIDEVCRGFLLPHTVLYLSALSVCNAQFSLFFGLSSVLSRITQRVAKWVNDRSTFNRKLWILTIIDRWAPSLNDGKHYASIPARRVRGTTTVITITLVTESESTVFGESCGQQWSYSVHRVTSPTVPTSLYAPVYLVCPPPLSSLSDMLCSKTLLRHISVSERCFGERLTRWR